MRGGAWSRYRHDARIRAYDLACWTNATDRGPQSPDGSASRSGSQERDKARETAAVNEDVMEEILGQRDTAVNELGVDQARVETLTAERDQAREERDQVREERDVLSENVDAVVDVVKALEPNRRDLNRAMAAARLTKSYSGWLAGAVERGRGQVR